MINEEALKKLLSNLLELETSPYFRNENRELLNKLIEGEKK